MLERVGGKSILHRNKTLGSKKWTWDVSNNWRRAMDRMLMVKGERGCCRRRHDYRTNPTGDSQGLCAISRQEGFNGISALVVACIKHGDVLIGLPVDGVWHWQFVAGWLVAVKRGRWKDVCEVGGFPRRAFRRGEQDTVRHEWNRGHFGATISSAFPFTMQLYFSLVGHSLSMPRVNYMLRRSSLSLANLRTLNMKECT